MVMRSRIAEWSAERHTAMVWSQRDYAYELTGSLKHERLPLF